MTYGTIFSGIGGWELGLQACGWKLRWQCERERFCQVLLNERFGVPICGDANGLVPWLDRGFGREAARVDAIVGSPPCQPFSVAGKKGGSGDKRHLFPAFACAVRKLRPRWVLMEQVANVLGIEDGRVFGGYAGALVEIGYDLVWHCIPACAVGANHERDRLWLVAYRNGGGPEPDVSGKGREDLSESFGDGKDAADANGTGCEEQHAAGFAAKPAHGSRSCDESDVSDADGSERDGRSGVVQMGRSGSAESFAGAVRFGGDQWSVEPDVGRVAHGIPFRVDRLKGLGNALLPQIPYLIGQAINEMEKGLNVEG